MSYCLAIGHPGTIPEFAPGAAINTVERFGSSVDSRRTGAPGWQHQYMSGRAECQSSPNFGFDSELGHYYTGAASLLAPMK
jgi:hypothetical protein